MVNLFFDVFPTLKLTGDSKGLLAEAEVTKVTTTSAKTFIRVYIHSRRLITKDIIYKVENEIANQLFKESRIRVKIIEKFTLSSQYTPQKLYDAYKESILMELKNYSIIEYNIMRQAEIEFTNEYTMKMTISESIVSEKKTDELKKILEKIFLDRCGFEVNVIFEYKEAKKSKYAINSEKEIKEEVRQILKNINANNVAKGDNEHSNADEYINNQSDVASKETVKKADVIADKAVKNEEHLVKATAKTDNDSAKKPFEKREFQKRYSYKKSDNPDVLYGRDFEDDEIVAIETIQSEMGEVIIRGQIRTVEKRELRNEKTIITFDVTDFTDTITVKMFARNEQLPDILPAITEKSFIKLKGVTTVDRFDGELTIASVVGIKKATDARTKRQDTSVEKRVELHCHTKMSDMDGVSDVSDIIKQAAKWGHNAIAITDHGAVQAFPDANHTLDKIDNKDFKIIYGVEGYLVDDTKSIIVDSKGQTFDDTYVIFDIETTGFSPKSDRIIEIGAIKMQGGKYVDEFSTFVNPDIPIPFRIEELTHINDSMVKDAPFIEDVLPKFLEFCEGAVLVAHNAEFDVSFIDTKARDILGIELTHTVVDTVALSRVLISGLAKFKLDTVAKALGVSLENHHRAVDDAKACADIFVALIERLKLRNINNLDEANELSKLDAEAIMKMNTYHVIILAKNNTGRVNMYRLISDSNLKYYRRRPRIPKSEILKHREGLIIGSACEAGDLYQAILRNQPEEEIARIVKFYDYLEIQPLGNNNFMIESDNYAVNSEEDLIEINKKIVKLGEQFNKPVVGTCDVHFLNPEDEVYRRIIMAGQGFKDSDNQAPLYLRTTEEMLKEFEYLGSDKAHEIVIENTNLIADMCDKISPVRPDKCPPVIEDSDKTLRKICYDTAHAMYGEELPEIVTERLERELNSIISNGYSVMYIIAQKLVWKSNEDGYLVGSRGSVGSSLAATMSGITEVNPLSPHYYCEKCHYNEFDSEDVKKFAGGAGCDMPDKKCPVCGEQLIKAGFDIPFETFLGFKGNKEPDIDLNFSGEYQAKAHAYVEVIFGKGQTFKAGTIGTLADKTAYGYVKKYYEERGCSKRNSEINRIVEGCVGVRRTTGQHPGGIIVLPLGEEIHSFTPIQHPANDMTSNIVTTHFDYHSIDHNLLKLDILGHDDPTMIRMLEDLTGVSARDIPLDSKEVMSLFKDTSALSIDPEDIGGCKLGALGIPEFGTDFAMQMLIDTQPKYFSDLVRIAGLSHGTDVWLGNAQTLLQEGKATISTAICTRDDIMIYLIGKGLDKELSFTIMESVRKGKGLKPEWEEEMISHGVPDWYIWSCKKIKYMFPKAHAAAYVMMAWRIAYFKVFYPLAYYAAYFSIRASAFSYEIMCMGRDRLEYYLNDYKKRSDTLSKKEQDTLKDMRIVQEMYARGFEFVPIDLFTAKAHHFQIIDGKLMPALSTIDGLGDKAADAVVEAAKDGMFLSKDDFRDRTKVSKTVIELMDDLGILGDLPDTNQLSLFDL